MPEENRTCLICDKNEIENEVHFLLKFPAYTQPRVIMRHHIEKMGETYTENQEILKLLLSKKSYLGITADYPQYATDIIKKKSEKLNPT